MGHTEIGWKGMNWIHLVQVAHSCECGNEPSSSIKGIKFLD
jgi:hypothetical protein